MKQQPRDEIKLWLKNNIRNEEQCTTEILLIYQYLGYMTVRVRTTLWLPEVNPNPNVTITIMQP